MADLEGVRVAVQMDPIEGVNIDSDTTFALMEAAQARGATLFEYQPKHLWCEDGRVFAAVRPVRVRREKGAHVEAGARRTVELKADADVILMRQDPPFDMGYITAAHFLELIADTVVVLNDPAWVRSSPEKILPLLFPDLQPPTLIGRDAGAIARFRETHRDIILKPLYGFGGGGVFRVRPDDPNFDSILLALLAQGPEPVVAQAFLPAVSEGDKRVILIDGEVAGGFNRRPPQGAHRSNLAVGGTAEATELSPADLEVCRRIGPELKRRNLVLVGIDLIGGRLTEINVTSPTGLLPLKRLAGIDGTALFWEAALRRLAARRG